MHPQHWPADLDCAGKNVVVIGSGATAVTLIPSIATDAAQVTMLQRSPSYIVALPAHDGIGGALQRVLPRTWAYRLIRWKNVLLSMALFQFSRRRPAAMRRWLVRQAQQRRGVMLATAARYNPWSSGFASIGRALFRCCAPAMPSIARTGRQLHARVSARSGELLPGTSYHGYGLKLKGSAARCSRRRGVPACEALCTGHDAHRRAEPVPGHGLQNASWTLSA